VRGSLRSAARTGHYSSPATQSKGARPIPNLLVAKIWSYRHCEERAQLGLGQTEAALRVHVGIGEAVSEYGIEHGSPDGGSGHVKEGGASEANRRTHDTDEHIALR
jgi:hypothetical protein